MTFKMFSHNDITLCNIIHGSSSLYLFLFFTTLILSALYLLRQHPSSTTSHKIAELEAKLAGYNLINAALQIRHTIEKLCHHLPLHEPRWANIKARAGTLGLWDKLWEEIWANAASNPQNPIYPIRKKARGEHEKKNFMEKGRRLYTDMSSLIHGWDRRGWEWGYFDQQTEVLVEALRPQVKDGEDSVDWDEELGRIWGGRRGGTDQVELPAVNASLSLGGSAEGATKTRGRSSVGH
jgi:hypothetical protein